MGRRGRDRWGVEKWRETGERESVRERGKEGEVGGEERMKGEEGEALWKPEMSVGMAVLLRASGGRRWGVLVCASVLRWKEGRRIGWRMMDRDGLQRQGGSTDENGAEREMAEREKGDPRGESGQRGKRESCRGRERDGLQQRN
ncbi:hypothetical protein MRB53_002288 [Persea americana]|uniref:Uncharacterized protein n=1 Tax=Persea americana TaxID=3435 RepID=A0ACC2MV14_PERAE|nr:hypothetical protein MRB53_002288 [Persea americana]